MRLTEHVYLLYSLTGGQAKTLMFVHINPEVDAFGETVSTLKFAERVASIDLGAARSVIDVFAFFFGLI